MSKKHLSSFCFIVLFTLAGSFLSSFNQPPQQTSNILFPYEKAGFSKREAAAHILNRFTFGPTPQSVDEVLAVGLEKWFIQQLDGTAPDVSVNKMLAKFESLNMTNVEILNTYPKPGQILRKAMKDGAIDKDAIKKDDKKDYRKNLKKFMDENGYKPQQEMVRDLVSQKILRAAYSNNQLKEVLTDFWFNHFNVSLSKGESRQFVTTYERDVIRPNVTGKFETLVLATAKSPAMLTYLDNFRSVASNNKPGPGEQIIENAILKQIEERQMNDTTMQQMDMVEKIKKAKKAQGLNENYAREIMELHTLGVDGGYTQKDVTEAARILTGWTLFPMGQYGGMGDNNILKRLNENQLKRRGFVHEGDFLFAANRHDKDPKTVMGVQFTSNSGYEEGVKLIHMLATHPSTAKFISRKLAVRFVSDNPSEILIEKMSKRFLETKGDIREVLITMATAPEFWNKKVIREKTKSPFELAISAVRSLDAKIEAPFQLYNWITKMGQQLYAYQAPTGFPDNGEYWINTGSLLNRMNFGLALATQRIPGIRFNLSKMNGNKEPESADAALTVYSKILMPERNVDETIRRLKPLLNDPELDQKVQTAASKTTDTTVEMDEDDDDGTMNTKKGKKKNGKINYKKNNNLNAMQLQTGNNTMLAQVVGIIIGSPEFQRK